MQTNTDTMPFLRHRRAPGPASACSRHRKTAAAWLRAEARLARKRLRRAGRRLARTGEELA